MNRARPWWMVAALLAVGCKFAAEADSGPFVWYGLTQQAALAAAKESGTPFRIAREDDRLFPLTKDLRPGRVTAEIEQGVVVLATIEGPGGRREGAKEPELRPYLGLTEAAAAAMAGAADRPFRVTRRDDEMLAVTMDYRPDRVNVELTDGVVVFVNGG